MKRLLDCVSQNTRSKRPRLVGTDTNQIMVSATHLYNYMVGDPLVDWLKQRNRSGTRHSPAYLNANGFDTFIMKRGVEFEEKLVEYINQNLFPVVTVSPSITTEGISRTHKLMLEGAPIIHSAPVQSTRTNTQGIIDLLVRSDYLCDLVEDNPISDTEKNVPAPKLKSNYHYVVVDIKFTTLPLRADATHLVNSGSMPAYKAQCLVYTELVGEIQGYTAPYAFLMGRRWRCTRNGTPHANNSCLGKLGKIDYDDIDAQYKQRTADAIKWVRDVKTDSDKWTTNPPTREELYPNMCVDSGIWNGEKEKIADDIGEMTKIWHVGVRHRKNAVEKQIFSWRDKSCTTASMGLRGVRAPVIDAIISINRQKKDKIRPSRIQNNLHDWKVPGNELFVDFETFGDMFDDFTSLPAQNRTDMIFMIGVGYEEEGRWVYKSFTCTQPTLLEEYRIMDEFAQLVADRNYPKIYHWVADEKFWRAAENRQFDITDDSDIERKDHISDDWQVKKWADLSQVFQTEPIVIKDCFKYGLKSVSKAMQKHDMIKGTLDSSCDNGMSAMIKAWKVYRSNKDVDASEIMKDIVKYNEFDCKVLWEILSYLRKNHS